MEWRISSSASLKPDVHHFFSDILFFCPFFFFFFLTTKKFFFFFFFFSFEKEDEEKKITNLKKIYLFFSLFCKMSTEETKGTSLSTIQECTMKVTPNSTESAYLRVWLRTSN